MGGGDLERILSAVVLSFAASTAAAYDTGTLTCQRIGELAAETVAAKRSGVSDEASLATLVRPFDEGGVERRLLVNLVDIIYRNELLVAMTPSDAYIVFLRDCMTGKGLPGGR
jgi:hypothetical protein